MKLMYKISQTVNNGYDTFDSAIVVADSVERARLVHPSPYAHKWSTELNCWLYESGNPIKYDAWAHPSEVVVELLGTMESDLDIGTVVCASFNAG